MQRAVRTVLRLIAAGISVVGGMNAGLELMRHRMQGAEMNLWRLGLGLLGVVIGAIVFATSTALAQKMTDDIDDE